MSRKKFNRNMLCARLSHLSIASKENKSLVSEIQCLSKKNKTNLLTFWDQYNRMRAIMYSKQENYSCYLH